VANFKVKARICFYRIWN